MGIEAFRKGMEYLKTRKDDKAIARTKENLEKSGDKDRLEVFNEVFGAPNKKNK